MSYNKSNSGLINLSSSITISSSFNTTNTSTCTIGNNINSSSGNNSKHINTNNNNNNNNNNKQHSTNNILALGCAANRSTKASHREGQFKKYRLRTKSAPVAPVPPSSFSLHNKDRPKAKESQQQHQQQHQHQQQQQVVELSATVSTSSELTATISITEEVNPASLPKPLPSYSPSPSATSAITVSVKTKDTDISNTKVALSENHQSSTSFIHQQSIISMTEKHTHQDIQKDTQKHKHSISTDQMINIASMTPQSPMHAANYNNHYNRPRSSSTTSSTTSSRSSRRVIFPTLYESPHRDTVSFKNPDKHSNVPISHSVPLPSIISSTTLEGQDQGQGLGQGDELGGEGLTLSPRSPGSLDAHNPSADADDVDTDLSLTLSNPSLYDDTDGKRDQNDLPDHIETNGSSLDKALIPLSTINLNQLVIPAFNEGNGITKDATNAKGFSLDRRLKYLSPTSIITSDSAHGPVHGPAHVHVHTTGLPSILRNSSKNLMETIKDQKGPPQGLKQQHKPFTLNQMVPPPDDLDFSKSRIKSELSLQVSSLLLPAQKDKLSNSIHCLRNAVGLRDHASASGSGSIPPTAVHKSLSSTSTTTTRTMETHKSDPASTAAIPSPHKLRKSLSDSCLYSFQIKNLLKSHTAKAIAADTASSLSPTTICASQQQIQQPQQHPHHRKICYHSQSLGSVSNSKKERSNLQFLKQMTRHISHEEMGRNKIIRFDPRIWVHEIQCPPVDKIWYNAADMSRFKYEAILRIRKWSNRRMKRDSVTMMSTGTGRILAVDKNDQSQDKNHNRVIYTNPALSCEAEEDEDEDICLAHMLSLRDTALTNEIKSVLIVDSHDIFLKLLSKGFQMMLPHVQITTACTVDQASKYIEKAKSSKTEIKQERCTHGYDVIVIEERLKPHIEPRSKSFGRQPTWNGSSLIQKITNDFNSMSSFEKRTKRHPLVIGISAYLNKDKQRLEESGSDLVWGKPPPMMCDSLRMELLKKLMLKRNRPHIDALFQ